MPSACARRCTASSCTRVVLCIHSWKAMRRAYFFTNFLTARDRGSRYSRGQLSQPAPEGPGPHQPLRRSALRVFRDRFDVEIEEVERQTARRAVRAALRRVQWIDADHRRAARGGELDQRAQVAEVADAPVALRAHAVELHHEAPHAPALREEAGLAAAARLELDLCRPALGSERLCELLARRGVDVLLVAPDVEIAFRNFCIRGQDRNYSRR